MMGPAVETASSDLLVYLHSIILSGSQVKMEQQLLRHDAQPCVSGPWYNHWFLWSPNAIPTRFRVRNGQKKGLTRTICTSTPFSHLQPPVRFGKDVQHQQSVVTCSVSSAGCWSPRLNPQCLVYPLRVDMGSNNCYNTS